MDLIWDRYLYDSLKGTTREKRGKGVRRRVSTNVPSRWEEFFKLQLNLNSRRYGFCSGWGRKHDLFQSMNYVPLLGRQNIWSYHCFILYGKFTTSLQNLYRVLVIQVQSIKPKWERFVILMYNRGSSSVSMNDARKEPFTKSGRMIESIPPTQNSLYLHVKRAIYQGEYIWGQLQLLFLTLPSAAGSGLLYRDTD